jgi:hypothetical protein
MNDNMHMDTEIQGPMNDNINMNTEIEETMNDNIHMNTKTSISVFMLMLSFIDPSI